MASQMSVLVLPGAWHQPLHYDLLVETLRERGVKVSDDIAQAHWLATREVEKGRIVDVISHSYGGVPATGAFGGLGLATRKKLGKEGGVRNMIGMTTFRLPGGLSLVDLCGPLGHPPWIKQLPEGSSFPDDPETVFYNDVDEETRRKAVSLLAEHPIRVLETVVDPPTWNEFENIYYLKCSIDNAIPMFAQDLILEKLAEIAGIRPQVTKMRMGHSPMYFPDAIDWAAKIIGV